MKKEAIEMEKIEDNELRAEYVFSGGVRGKHYSAMQTGYTVTIHKSDGATVVKKVGCDILEAVRS
jgi:ATP-dependent exoDNAse (exonuclease V) alpha subunit